jgi:hypothetical protein
MLTGMDIPVAAGPWLVLGVALGILLPLLAALAVLALRRRPARPEDSSAPTPPATGLAQDDLPGFLESPPGAAPAAPGPGWAVLAPVAAPTRPDPPQHRRGNALVVVAAMAGTALLLVGLAAAVAGASRPDDRRAASTSPARGGTDARLTFGGVVLEPRAVGVTATYPVVEVSSDGDLSRARIRFPTFNCLAGEAPADPVVAGCTPTPTEYAELASPDLAVAVAVAEEGDGFVLTGRFPTETRPNGSAPEPTGRTYELRISVTPAGPPAGDGWRPARGVLELGPGRATTVGGPGVSELRSGS